MGSSIGVKLPWALRDGFLIVLQLYFTPSNHADMKYVVHLFVPFFFCSLVRNSISTSCRINFFNVTNYLLHDIQLNVTSLLIL